MFLDKKRLSVYIGGWMFAIVQILGSLIIILK